MGDEARPALRRHVEEAAANLEAAGVPSPHHDAVALAAHTLDRPDLTLAAPPDLPDGFAERYAAAIERRRSREPLQHIVGSTGFRRLTLAVEPGVFVPRPETEVVAGAAIDAAARVAASGREPLVVDLCCGAGGIAAAVATEVPASRVVAVDVSPPAVDLAWRNARAVGAAGIQVDQGDVRDPALLAEFAGAVDVVVSNPPYIPPDGRPVEPEVRDHDPEIALYGGGPDGLDVPRAVIAAAARLLRPGGEFVMEHADVQGRRVRAIVDASGDWVEARTGRDLAGRDRFVVATRA